MARLSRGKTFAVVHKTHHSLENFCGSSGRGHYVLYMEVIQGGNFRDWLKTAKVFPLKSFAVYGIFILINYAVIDQI